jgi:signal transduction histidine kinase
MDRDLEHEELVLVEKINTLINSKTSLEEVFKAIIEGMVNVFGYYSSGAYLLSDDKKYLFIQDYSIPNKISRAVEKLVGVKLKGYKIPLFEGSVLKLAIEDKEPIVVSDLQGLKQLLEHHSDKAYLRKLAGTVAKMSGLKSGVGIPLLADDEVVGMLGISSNEHDLNDTDVRRLKAFGVQAGLAIKKAKMYEELEDYSRSLESRVEKKTRELELTQGKLIESEKFSALGKLAAGVAHEINNPLGNISLSAELILMKETDPYKVKKLEIVLEQVESASRIVKNLLDYSRESELAIEQVDINREVEKALNLSKNNLRLSKVKLVKELAPDLPILNADPKKLQQVFLNIITNAIQAMADGGTLHLATYKEDGVIVVELDDTGPGIPSEIRDKVFDPFFTTKDLSTSAGLGLSVSKGILDEHQGSIEIRDSAIDGTRVLIKLPGGGG